MEREWNQKLKCRINGQSFSNSQKHQEVRIISKCLLWTFLFWHDCAPLGLIVLIFWVFAMISFLGWVPIMNYVVNAWMIHKVSFCCHCFHNILRRCYCVWRLQDWLPFIRYPILICANMCPSYLKLNKITIMFPSLGTNYLLDEWQ